MAKLNYKQLHLSGSDIQVGLPSDGYWETSQINPSMSIADAIDIAAVSSSVYSSSYAISASHADFAQFGGYWTGSSAGIRRVSAVYITGSFNQNNGNVTLLGGTIGTDVVDSIAIGDGTNIGNETINSSILGGVNNIIGAETYYNVLGGGYSNHIGDYEYADVIVGGEYNEIGGGYYDSFIGGGYGNVVNTASYGVIVGGDSNEIGADNGAIVGGIYNVVNSELGFIGCGRGNEILVNGQSDYSVIGGGRENIISQSSYAVIAGGYDNDIEAGSTYAFIGSGLRNEIYDAAYATIVGGNKNKINGGNYSGIFNGFGGGLSGSYSFIIGGNQSKITGSYSYIGGGNDNIIRSDTSFLGGGNNNIIRNDYSFIGAGQGLDAIGQHQSIFGKYNVSSSTAMFIIGSGSGVTTRKNIFLVDSAGDTVISGSLTVHGNANISGNVGIGNLLPPEKLTVEGNISASGIYYGDGSGLKNITPGSGSFWTGSGGEIHRMSNVGIGTTSPRKPLHVHGETFFGSSRTNLHTFTGSVLIGQDNVATYTPLRLYSYGAGDIELIQLHDWASTGTDRGAHISFKQSAATDYGAIGVLGGTSHGVESYMYFSTRVGNNFAERMRISEDGYLGIGTTNPSEKLEVHGDAVITGSTTFGDSGDDIHNFTGSIRQSGSESYFLNNVGIGTTNPAYTFHTMASSGQTATTNFDANFIAIQNKTNTNRNTARLGFLNSNDTAKAQIGAQFPDANGAGGGSRLFFNVQDTGSSTITAMKIDEAGYVGIGTETPQVKFHLHATTPGYPVDGEAIISDDGVAILNMWSDVNNDGNCPGFVRFNNGGTWTAPEYSWAVGQTAVGNSFRIAYAASAFANLGTSDLLTILPTGNVGIGTSSPIGKFDVYDTRHALNVSGSHVAIGTSASPSFDFYVNGNSYFKDELYLFNDLYTQRLFLGYGGQPTITNHQSAYWHSNFYIYNGGSGSICFQTRGLGRNVGIGTEDPSVKLEVHGDAVITGSVGIGTSSPIGILDVYDTRHALVVSGGNVGINRVNPSFQFHVEGTSYLKGDLYNWGNGYTKTLFLGYGVADGANLTNQQNNNKIYIYNTGTGSLCLQTKGGKGRVGIGTTDPQAEFHVTGSGIFEGNVGIGTSNPDEALHIYGNYIKQQNGVHYNLFGIQGGANVWNAYNTQGIRIRYSGSDAITIRSDTAGGIRAVGIGTSSPRRRFDVQGFSYFSNDVGIGELTASARLHISASGTDDLLQVGDDFLFVEDSGNVGIGTTDPVGNFHVYSQASNALVVSGGNVGIGTVNPDGTLHLYAATGNPNIYIGDSGCTHPFTSLVSTTTLADLGVVASSAGGFYLTGFSEGYNTNALILRGACGGVSVSASAIQFRAAKSNGSTNIANLSDDDIAYQFNDSTTGNYLTILGSGNVGIGTTNPSVKLEVHGNALITGSVSASAFYGNGDNLTGNIASSASIWQQSASNVFLNDTSWGLHAGADASTLFRYTESKHNLVAGQEQGLQISTVVVSGIADYGLVLGSLRNGGAGLLNQGSAITWKAEGSVGSLIYRNQVRVRGAWEDPTSGAEYGYLAFDTRESGSALTERMRITGDGSVGIGTTDPVGNLHVYSQASNALVVSGGNVGIGTTSPEKTLHVNDGNASNFTPCTYASIISDKDIGNSLQIGSEDGGGVNTGIILTAGTKHWIMNHGGKTDGNPFSIGYYVNDGAWDFDDGPHNWFCIDTGSNVGIGTSNPTEKLDVNGITRLGSSTKIGNNKDNTHIISGSVRIGTETEPSLLIYGYKVGDTELLRLQNWVSPAVGRGSHIQFYGGTIDYGAIGVLGGTVASNESYMYFNSRTGGTVAERMRISEDGYLGIGTTNPAARLHISGNYGTDCAIAFGDGDTTVRQAADDQLHWYFGGSLALQMLDGGITVGGDVNYPTIWREVPTATNPVFTPKYTDNNTGMGWAGTNTGSLIAGGVNVLNWTSDGNVGIRTTDPRQALEVNGAFGVGTNDGVYIGENGGIGEICGLDPGGSAYNDLGIRCQATTQLYLETNGNVGIGTTNPAEKLHVEGNIFITGSVSASALQIGGVAENYLMGNVGIGTTNPSWQLEVAHDIGNTEYGGLRLHNLGNDALDYLSLDFYHATPDYSTARIYSWTGASHAVPTFQIDVSDASHDLQNRMTIQKDGYVGIGTTNPTARLHISGSGTDDFFKVGNYMNVSGSGQVFVSSSIGIGVSGSDVDAKLHVYSVETGSRVFLVEGQNGTLFQVIDELSGSLFGISDISGLPIVEVFSDDKVVMGKYNTNALVVTGSKVGIGTAVPQTELHVNGAVSASDYYASGSAGITQMVDISGSDGTIHHLDFSKGLLTSYTTT